MRASLHTLPSHPPFTPGLAGAAFNESNRRVSILRRAILGRRPNAKNLEAIISISMVNEVGFELDDALIALD